MRKLSESKPYTFLVYLRTRYTWIKRIALFTRRTHHNNTERRKQMKLTAIHFTDMISREHENGKRKTSVLRILIFLINVW